MKKINIQEFEGILASGLPIQIVDVREPAEYAAEHLKGAIPVALSSFSGTTGQNLSKTQPLYVICQSGNRACKAADKFEALGFADVRVLEGGLRAWVEAGKPIEKSKSGIWNLERQVRFAAGSLVLIGVILAWKVSMAWLLLSGFVAGGLMFSAVTDTCGMAMVLARMPWNQKKGVLSCGS